MIDSNKLSRSTISYFTGSIVVTSIALVAGFAYGYLSAGTGTGFSVALTSGLSALTLTAILAVLEVTLSFDNAVVNATILRNWPERWRRLFLVAGILVAVLGMRLLFPIVLVSLSTSEFTVDGIISVIKEAFSRPAEYAAHLSASKYLVDAFGGAFLMMIATEFFFDVEKDTHWIGFFERRLIALGQIEAIQSLVTLGSVLLVSKFLAPPDEAAGFTVAGVLGVIAFIGTKGVGTLIGGEAAEAGEKIVRASVAGFLYLELLDASFSFDGVIGAFAVTTSLPIIMLGLGTGAYFVRSLTVLLVDREALAEYRYLSHGAYYAIGVLSCLMFASVRYEIPDLVTGLSGGLLILVAFLTSQRANRRDSLDAGTNATAAVAP